jgi:hypothetical protein
MLFPARGRVYVWGTPKKDYNPEFLIPTAKHERGPIMIWAGTTWYSVGSIFTVHGRLTAREYVDRLGNQVHPMIQTLFPNNDAVFQDDNSSIHTAGTVQSWFEEDKVELCNIPHQHSNQILTSLKSSCQFWRLQ